MHTFPFPRIDNICHVMVLLIILGTFNAVTVSTLDNRVFLRFSTIQTKDTKTTPTLIPTNTTQPHTTPTNHEERFSNETTNTVVSDIQKDPTVSSGGQDFITKQQFIKAIACASSAFFILLLIEISSCCRKKVNNTNNQLIDWPQTTNVSDEISFCNVSWSRNKARQQANNDIGLYRITQLVHNQESTTATQTFHQAEDDTAFYDEIGEDLEATCQMGPIGNVRYVDCDVDNDGYLEIIA
ncbi:uncharacterized protein LOC117116986 [Anneissia japonica]|uniref:uncharacterized protein LOC117116986 n=1 Tax=Anneissia japonica TaxID=1529436 RepID=UPI00142594B3|nr:uncharacterized protein LOC117116986 [Anneissia japonica]